MRFPFAMGIILHMVRVGAQNQQMLRKIYSLFEFNAQKSLMDHLMNDPEEEKKNFIQAINSDRILLNKWIWYTDTHSRHKHPRTHSLDNRLLCWSCMQPTNCNKVEFDGLVWETERERETETKCENAFRVTAKNDASSSNCWAGKSREVNVCNTGFLFHALFPSLPPSLSPLISSARLLAFLPETRNLFLPPPTYLPKTHIDTISIASLHRFVNLDNHNRPVINT